jgi:DNA-binding transcriptional ArsR family regulator
MGGISFLGLVYIPIWVYNIHMARVPTTSDPFNAVAEPRRRQILDVLGAKELAVNEIVVILGWSQPTVSKHLKVLKQVGLVSERRIGQQRLYRVNAGKLKPIHDWVISFEKYWTQSFDRLDQVLIDMQKKETQK